MKIAFLLNGESVEIANPSPTETLLDHLRQHHGLTGTKEGCNEGDCGACTVLVRDASGARALNACILLLPQLHGKSVTTVEGLAAPDGRPHPAQQAMVEHHGSQCGFCTPGFVMSLAAAQLNGDDDADTFLAGNLCRCTGYAPIRRAAAQVAGMPPPPWLGPPRIPSSDRPAGEGTAPTGTVGKGAESAAPAATFWRPGSADELARLCSAHPQATLVAGATDVGLWVTKALRDISPVIFLAGCDDLREVAVTDEEIRLGALVSIERLRHVLADVEPAFAAMLRRFGSTQVRNAATLGGNIANGSPIGDTPPPLIALDARLHLRLGNRRRSIALEDFFLDYGRQDRAPGEFVEAISIPRMPPAEAGRLHVHKVSKRLDQDISALLGAFRLHVADGTVRRVRIAFGGMAPTPRRARATEAALAGRPWCEATIREASAALAEDFRPISDMRASAGYRLKVAQNLLWRVWHEDRQDSIDIREVKA